MISLKAAMTAIRCMVMAGMSSATYTNLKDLQRIVDNKLEENVVLEYKDAALFEKNDTKAVSKAVSALVLQVGILLSAFPPSQASRLHWRGLPRLFPRPTGCIR